MVLKLYAVSDGPSSLSVRQALKVLDIPFDLTNVDYGAGEHMTPEYAMMNPQKEIPVLEDDGFYLGESNAILQYLCDKYRPQSELLYPQEPRARPLENLRRRHERDKTFHCQPTRFDSSQPPDPSSAKN
ncbi:unnamed protein product [Leptidea sinapis]|uniref:GST N-terminal domain-containing protein n=1 Tax=Leptidea sinapis TaxID=189913 RepID=A0A5E4PZP3_9NEOP|nr:unnamed protein product [Leptidea sinapis]